MRGRLAKSVLSSSRRKVQELAAWELLAAVRDLFPDRFAELRALRDWLEDDSVNDRGGEDDTADADEFRRRVREWTSKNNVSCSAVDRVAAEIAVGNTGPEPVLTEVRHVGGESIDTTPPIHAKPFDETLNEFVDRARMHYNEVRGSFLERGFKKRPAKREHDHFRYLVAHLIGGYSWAAIERNYAQLKVSKKSPKTIAGEARKTARLIGIDLSKKPGPRPGSHAPRRRRRR